MKHSLLLVLASILATQNAHAFLAGTAITKYTLPVYAVYITSDATCLTGLTAVKAMSATPEEMDFAKTPTLGTATLPTDGIKCVVLVAKGVFAWTWAAGTYTTSSKFGTTTYADSLCNAGGTGTYTMTVAPTCQATRSTVVDWPAAILTDLAAVGLTGSTNCTTTASAALFPIYISTHSKCVGDTVLDTAIGGTCLWSLYTAITSEGYRANMMYKAPTAEGDYQRGLKLSTPASGAASYTLKIDPLVGGTSGSGCGISGPPIFSLQ